MRVQGNVFQRKMREEAGVLADNAVVNQCKAKLLKRRSARHAIEERALLKQRNEDCLK